MKLSEYLASLGNTADEVANTLRKQSIKGIKESTCHCPILNAIYKACPDYWSGLRIVNGNKYVDEKTGEVRWAYYASLNDAQICDPELPQPVMNFIGKFDAGLYPDLEATVVKTVRVRTWA